MVRVACEDLTTICKENTKIISLPHCKSVASVLKRQMRQLIPLAILVLVTLLTPATFGRLAEDQPADTVEQVSVPLQPGWNAVALQCREVTQLSGTAGVAGLARMHNGSYQVLPFTQASLNALGGFSAFWVYASAANSFSYSGTGSGLDVNLVPGYNLVSFANRVDLPASQLNASPATSLTLTEIEPDNSYRAVDRTTGVIRPGRACWVFAAAAARLTLAAPAPSPVPSVTGLSLTPVSRTLNRLTDANFELSASLANGENRDVTAQATWSTSDGSIAAFLSPGQIRALNVGTTRVTAVYGGAQAFAEVSVVDRAPPPGTTATPVPPAPPASQLLAVQDFELVPATPTWTFTGTPNIVSGNSGAGAAPPNSPLGIGGSRAWELTTNSGGLTLSFASVAVPSGFARVRLRFRVAAMNLNGSSGGPDNLDFVRVALNTGGGLYSRMEIRGATTDNSFWPYSATGVASLNALPATIVVFQPTSSGLQTTQGYSTAEIVFDPVPTQVAMNLTLRSSSSSDTWLVDDLTLTAER